MKPIIHTELLNDEYVTMGNDNFISEVIVSYLEDIEETSPDYFKTNDYWGTGEDIINSFKNYSVNFKTYMSIILTKDLSNLVEVKSFIEKISVISVDVYDDSDLLVNIHEQDLVNEFKLLNSSFVSKWSGDKITKYILLVHGIIKRTLGDNFGQMLAFKWVDTYILVFKEVE